MLMCSTLQGKLQKKMTNHLCRGSSMPDLKELDTDTLASSAPGIHWMIRCLSIVTTRPDQKIKSRNFEVRLDYQTVKSGKTKPKSVFQTYQEERSINGVTTASIISKLANRVAGTDSAWTEQFLSEKPKKRASSRLPIKPWNWQKKEYNSMEIKKIMYFLIIT